MLDDDFCLMGDGVTGALDGPLAGLAFSLSDWGWVIRTLAHYVRDTKALSLEAGVRRMTLAPALAARPQRSRRAAGRDGGRRRGLRSRARRDQRRARNS